MGWLMLIPSWLWATVSSNWLNTVVGRLSNDKYLARSTVAHNGYNLYCEDMDQLVDASLERPELSVDWYRTYLLEA